MDSTIKKECSYCNDIEDIIHMLYEYEVNTDIWIALGKHVKLFISIINISYLVMVWT